jgi:hypothetical protein
MRVLSTIVSLHNIITVDNSMQDTCILLVQILCCFFLGIYAFNVVHLSLVMNFCSL